MPSSAAGAFPAASSGPAVPGQFFRVNGNPLDPTDIKTVLPPMSPYPGVPGTPAPQVERVQGWVGEHLIEVSPMPRMHKELDFCLKRGSGGNL